MFVVDLSGYISEISSISIWYEAVFASKSTTAFSSFSYLANELTVGPVAVAAPAFPAMLGLFKEGATINFLVLLPFIVTIDCLWEAWGELTNEAGAVSPLSDFLRVLSFSFWIPFIGV